jgi:hypothetical protein
MKFCRMTGASMPSEEILSAERVVRQRTREISMHALALIEELRQLVELLQGASLTIPVDRRPAPATEEPDADLHRP